MLKTFLPSASSSFFSSALQMVVLPAPERPVIQSVTPFWPSTLNLFSEPSRQFCPGLHSMMLRSGRASIFARLRPTTTSSGSGAGQPATVGA